MFAGGWRRDIKTTHTVSRWRSSWMAKSVSRFVVYLVAAAGEYCLRAKQTRLDKLQLKDLGTFMLSEVDSVLPYNAVV